MRKNRENRKFKPFLLVSLMCILCLGTTPSSNTLVSAANGVASWAALGSVTKSYVLITNKISELEYNSSHSFTIKKVGLEDTSITWTSSNTKIATVSSTGKVVAKSSGYVTITAKDLISGKKSTCKLYVRPKATDSKNFTYTISNKRAMITGYSGSKTQNQVVIPSKLGGYPVSQIAEYTFYNQKHITSIDFPSSITKIGDYAFYNCSSLVKLNLPLKLKTLGEGAFASCTELTTCVFPSSMLEISAYAFNNCTSLKEVTLPSYCKILGENIFSATGLGSLTNLQIAATMDTDIFLTDTEKQVFTKMKKIIAKIITSEDTDVEKVKKIHDWIILNSTYDTTVNASQGTPKSSFLAQGIILNKTAVCSGYAEAFSIFMSLLDIECKYMVGTGNGVSHAWNSVKLDGKWYQIDVTWDDPLPDTGGISYKYFLITDSKMALDHRWDKSYYPAATATKYRYYAYKDDICKTDDQVRARIERGITEQEEWITLLTPPSINIKSIIYEFTNSYSARPEYQLGDYIVNVISIK